MSSGWKQAFLGLGSNMGDREALLVQAVNMLHQTPGIRVVQSSAIYETDPVGYTEQDAFFNIVVEIETVLSPADLLACTQAIEHELGRVRTIRWGPRTLDIDILLYDQMYIREGELQVPHPRMGERAFVLIPLADIAPNVEVPQEVGEMRQRIQVKEILAALPDVDGVRRWKPLLWKDQVKNGKVENS
jgi:2-amino-4-hydroxy-6-hydroxymethyldihydropteridine diphosphokinase